MTNTPLLLSSSSLSPFAFRSSRADVSSIVHAAAAAAAAAAAETRSSLAPYCSARVSIKFDGSVKAARRPFHAFRYNGVFLFNGFSATSPPQFVVCKQAEETTEPMHSDKTYKIFSGTTKTEQFQDFVSKMGPDFKIKQVKGCGKNVELPEAVMGCHVYLLYHISPSPYNNVEELLSMIDACKAGKATNVTVVIPFAAKVSRGELFNLVKEIAHDHEVHQILSFDFVPVLYYENAPPDIAIDTQTIIRNSLEKNDHGSDLVIVTTQKSEEVNHTYKKDFQLLAIIDDKDDTAKKVDILGNVNGNISTILIENTFRTNGIAAGDTSFLGKKVYTCDKSKDSVKILKDAIINSILPRNPNTPTSG